MSMDGWVNLRVRGEECEAEGENISMRQWLPSSVFRGGYSLFDLLVLGIRSSVRFYLLRLGFFWDHILF